jgi:putative redox protein
MQTKVKWIDNISMLGTTESGHNIIMDGAPEFGGQNLGARPMEMLLLGLGGCTSVDVVMMLKKMRQKISACEVIIDAKRSEEHPKVFTKIHLTFGLKGENLDRDKIKKAINLSAEKYCSASIMLGAVAKITHEFKIS